jgi:hypothetical protein
LFRVAGSWELLGVRSFWELNLEVELELELELELEVK